MTSFRVSLFARFPVAGVTKTRLIPAVGGDGAATIHRRLVERTIATLRASGLAFEVRTTGAPEATFGTWLGGDVALVDQGSGDLGARLARVAAPAILIGADAPGLSPKILKQAAAALEDRAVVIGPAFDGGYYLIGFRAPVPFLFDAMPWGTDAVLAETIRRLDARGIATAQLEPLHDVDRPEDLTRWPDLTAAG